MPCYELETQRINFRSQVQVPIEYDGIEIDTNLTLDLIVEDQLIVELKAVEHLLPIHEAQILTYLRITNVRLGLLLNFNNPYLKDGIKRIAL